MNHTRPTGEQELSSWNEAQTTFHLDNYCPINFSQLLIEAPWYPGSLKECSHLSKKLLRWQWQWSHPLPSVPEYNQGQGKWRGHACTTAAHRPPGLGEAGRVKQISDLPHRPTHMLAHVPWLGSPRNSTASTYQHYFWFFPLQVLRYANFLLSPLDFQSLNYNYRKRERKTQDEEGNFWRGWS